MLKLIPTTISDLETLFQFQKDEESNQMAAFTSENQNDKEAYLTKWKGIVENTEIPMHTIWLKSEIVGSILYFNFGDETNVSYIIDRKYWGKNFATLALSEFLSKFPNKTFYARTAFDNIGSQKVLEKNGFTNIGKEQGFANARQSEITEYIFIRKA